jgi:poly(3-hydroxybutyrate) depolymerase
MGPGGGMMHYLACNTHLSRRFAAFAAVGGAFYEGDGPEDRSWGECLFGRRPVPVLEIHGEDDKKYPLLQATKKADKRLLPAFEWVKHWSKYNNCGDTRSQPTISAKSNAVFITQLDGGQVSESLTYAGGATKTAYRCGMYRDRTDDDFTSEETSLGRISVLHYALKGFKHGWPRLQFQPEDVEFHGNTITPPGSPNFDASAVILNYFSHHRLPPANIIMAQAKDLLIERGAKVYKADERLQEGHIPHNEL